METQIIIILALIVFGAVIAFALYSKRSAEALEDDPNAALAEEDGGNKGDAPSKVTTAKPIPPMR